MDKMNALHTKKLLSVISNEFLELIILPTEQCNFRCTYCYEDFSIGKMKTPIVEGIKALMKNRVADLKILKISWFGGEPLAAKDIVMNIANHAMDLKKLYPNLQYQSGMTTNGYQLNIKLLTKLCELGINEYQISLDGSEKLHNTTRLRADGAGTFNKIWDNLISAKNSTLDFKITLRIHVTPDNLDSLPHLVSDINQNFKNDSRFNVFFKTIENLGGPHSNTFRVLHGKDKPNILSELYQQIDHSIHIEKVENRLPYICYAAQANSFLIRANGRLGKCTVSLNDERNDIGEITSDGELILDNEKLNPWIRGVSTHHLMDLECPMVNFPSSSILGKRNITIKVEKAM